MMNRRQFLRAAAAGGLMSCTGYIPRLKNLYAFSNQANLSREEALFYKKLEDREIECTLCPRECRLGDKERGYCGVRENIGGVYYTLVYGKACSLNADPIEKKPFFHFLPGKKALSIATAGCNVNCKFCQNWEISQVRPEQIRHFDLPPPAVPGYAQKNNCPVIAYTYSEPVVFYEYMYDTSIKAREHGLRNVVITGGHINPEPLLRLIEAVDGIKVDLKAFSQDFYAKFVKGELQPVLEAIRSIARSTAWLEIVYLVIPTLNDGEKEISQMCSWVMSEVGPDVPVHFSRFYPMYLMKNLPPTPVSTLEKAYETAIQEGLRYVYIGNVPGHKAENTFCPRCRSTVIRRRGYQIDSVDLIGGKCKNCQNPIAGVWT